MISIVVPVFNESENIEPLLAEIRQTAEAVPISEVLYVNDASTDATADTLLQLHKKYPFLRVIEHTVQAGQSAAMWSGVQEARNDIIMFLDGDGQNDPADMKILYETYQKRQTGTGKKAVMIAGQRRKRQDNLLRKFSSRLANAIRSAALKDGTRDTGCSLKLVRRQDYIKLPYFNHMHRYLPALLKREYVDVVHVDVSHRPRSRGVSKYGFWDRLRAGCSDLLGVMWLRTRGLPKGFSRMEKSIKKNAED